MFISVQPQNVLQQESQILLYKLFIVLVRYSGFDVSSSNGNAQTVTVIQNLSAVLLHGFHPPPK